MAPADAEQVWSFADPVFVLCNGRSGSTLLRFLLDGHPDLACPPETNLPSLCAQLATVWSLIEGAPLSRNRGDEPPMIPDAAIDGIRHMMDMMVGSYLGRRGKKRYCDKSLGTARFAQLLLRVYPQAKFICLYRHPMDVIASGLEACPWGLNGYGFDEYIASTPGNAVMAMARFWADNASVINAAEKQFPDSCHRVRYEDLVSDPEAVASELYEFLDMAQAPGVSKTCFSPERERFGPADYKIWYTSEITADSIGRGWSVPSGMIAPQILSVINELADDLGYLPVSDDWGTSEPPADFRLTADQVAAAATARQVAAAAAASHAESSAAPPADITGQAEDGADLAAATPTTSAGPDDPAAVSSGKAAAKPLTGSSPPARTYQGAPPEHAELRAALTAGVDRIDKVFSAQWRECMADTLVTISLPDDPALPATRYRIDLAARTVTIEDGVIEWPESDWDVIGSADAWSSVLTRRTNLSVALRACRLRYCDAGESDPMIADTRLALLSDLLGLSSWLRTVDA